MDSAESTMPRLKLASGGPIKLAAAIVFLSLAAIPSAHASPVCTNGTLTSYINVTTTSGGCTVGDVLFQFGPSAYDYTPASNQAPAAQPDSTDDVYLTIVDDGNSGSQVGFTFTTINGTSWNATDTGSAEDMDINLSFTAILENQPPNAGFDNTFLALNATLADSSPNTGIAAYEYIEGGGNNPLNGADLGQIVFFFLNSVNNYTQVGGTTLSPLDTDLDVNKNLYGAAGALGDSATINSFSETFTYAPEPGAPIMVAIGLLFLACVRWRKRLMLPLACLAVFTLGPSNAHASTCATTTLANYISQGGCTIGDVLFTVVSYTPTGGAPAASSFTVVPTGSTLNPELEFEPVLQNNTTTPMSITLVITAQASVNPISDVSTGITGGGSCFLNSCAKITGGVTTNVGGINIPYNETPSNPSGNQTFSLTGGTQNTNPNPLPLSTSVTITDVLTLTGGGNFASGAHVSNIDLTISQTPTTPTSTPEPLTFLAIGGSLIVLAGGARRVRRGSLRAGSHA
jgi:hypothetical protein